MNVFTHRWTLLPAISTAAIMSTLALPPAQAAGSAAKSVEASRVSALVAEVEGALGRTHSAGSYLDHGRLVVTVTDSASATQVRERGAVPRIVRRSGSRLDAAVAALAGNARIPGTAWAIDPRSDQVVVSADATLTGARLAVLTRVVRALGKAVRIEHVPGRFAPTVSGGDPVYFGSYRCTLGFNVKKGSGYYFLDAGHCGNDAATWYSDKPKQHPIGTTAESSFPGNDYALVRYSTSSTPPGDVSLGNGRFQDITSAATPLVGQSVTHSGSTTGVSTGRVTALNATVNYAQGSVSGLIKTNACSQKGDSGGPLFSGTTAYGITSGGNLSCGSGGVSYYQPVTEALQRYGVEVY
ncbi:S1 family peptidase [Streptomyces sp. LP11]|uniref:S1 family peptidase n=1 Tax=Streptomyces pyxinicus TaxID=2970331 RepID=A0ABT2B673_9ACTN|nr:S1 family peptidase [Streptomyces sp. LP11]MCS0603600.1 S1 family peptidase [Streptomyces sp. LP11]